MSSDPVGAEEDARLGALVDAYQRRRDADPTYALGAMRPEAGALYDRLASLVGGLDLLYASMNVDDRLPERVGPYGVVRRLGRGATGVVYEAEAPDGRRVAVKVLRPSLALTPGGRARFEREFDAAGRLDHPHIVKVLDRGEAAGRLYLVMELLDGVPLGELRGHLGARRLAALFAPVARALGHADRAGLLHRDLKPGNLILRRDGRLVVADLGVAKLSGETLTATNAVLGTPGFLSPEQAAGRSHDADVRADVYGLGAAMRFVAPGALPHIVGRCLRERPEERYPDADSLARDLERAARRPLVRALLVIAPLVVAALLWSLSRRVAVVSYPAARLVHIDGGIQLEREGFETWRGEEQAVVHLRPRDVFDPEALAILGRAYGTQARLPPGDPPEPRRAANSAPPPLPPGDALRFELLRYPAAVRDEPYIHALAVSNLLAARQYADAYAAACRLAARHPHRREPLRLALLALWGLGLQGGETYRELYTRAVSLR